MKDGNFSQKTEKSGLVERAVTAKLPTEYGIFTVYGYLNRKNGEHHIALVCGDVDGAGGGGGGEGVSPVLTRLHSECLTGDALGSTKCDCGAQLQMSFRAIQAEGRGVLVYLRQEGRGIGLINKLRAYALQDEGLDTVEANIALGFPADMRDYSIAAEILHDLGIGKVRLLTNNPDKIAGLEASGIIVSARIPLETARKDSSSAYLRTKKEKMGHLFATM